MQVDCIECASVVTVCILLLFIYCDLFRQIPGPLTDEMEAERKLKEAAKKKAKRSAKKEKQKVSFGAFRSNLMWTVGRNQNTK